MGCCEGEVDDLVVRPGEFGDMTVFDSVTGCQDRVQYVPCDECGILD